MLKSLHRPLAVLALFGLAACGGGGSTPPAPSNLPTNSGLKQQNFVGIGDSLTFGEQSGGQLGVVTTSPVSAIVPPGSPAGAPGLVQPTQTNGFWALMYAQMNGIALDPALGAWNTDTALGAASTSPLPLIAAPGLGGQLVVSAVSPPFAPTHSSCDPFNQAAFALGSAQASRASFTAPIADLGVPGLTMHEAVSMTAPLTGPPPSPSCNYVTIPGDISSGGLQSLVEDESKLFYPVLGQFQITLGAGKVTQLNAAVSLQPKLTTVWLGANDALKFIFSHGQSPITDSPTQLATDLTTIVTTLEKAGSKVVVGNLPDILGNPSTGEIPVPQFFPQGKLSADLQALGIPSSIADADAAFVSANYTKGNGGFLTESGFFGLVSQIKANPTGQPNLDPNGPGSGDGPLYLDQTFAAQAVALIAGYNEAINSVANATGAALADIQTTFQGLAATGLPLGPGVTLTLQFGGGIIGYDGLHPANTGYALVANLFIGAADSKFGMTIPPLSNAQIGAIATGDTYNPFVVKSVNPAWPFPLP
jgi:lysophospholipase L1-like esterase